MTWWYWLILGLFLAGAEIMAPGDFFLLFFGIAALIVGGLAGFDLVVAEWLQWLLFSVFAIVSLLVFRPPLIRMSRAQESHPVDTMIGEDAILLEDLGAGQTGKAELRGTTWSARNTGRASLHKGQRVRVSKVDGLTLWLRSD